MCFATTMRSTSRGIARDSSRASVEADLVLTLDRLTTKMVKRLALPGEVAMLGDYAGSGEEVADPYGQDWEAYCACADHVAALVERVADRLEADMPPT